MNLGLKHKCSFVAVPREDLDMQLHGRVDQISGVGN